MEKYRKACRRQNQRYYAKTSNLYPPKAWTSAEDAMVLDHKIPDRKLGQKAIKFYMGCSQQIIGYDC